MYDCQQDNYTDFSLQNNNLPGLSGQLTATPLHPNDTAALSTLAEYSLNHGYEVQHDSEHIVINRVTLQDALNINARFGNDLIISCDLRCKRPALF